MHTNRYRRAKSVTANSKEGFIPRRVSFIVQTLIVPPQASLASDTRAYEYYYYYYIQTKAIETFEKSIVLISILLLILAYTHYKSAGLVSAIYQIIARVASLVQLNNKTIARVTSLVFFSLRQDSSCQATRARLDPPLWSSLVWSCLSYELETGQPNIRYRNFI